MPSGLAAELTEQRFGKLVVVSRSPTPQHLRDQRSAYWLCRCDCGNERVICTGYLRRKSEPFRSCGCAATAAAVASHTTHGMSHSPEYDAWKAMHARCSNPKNPRFKRYGGRGIKVCDRWADFAPFFADMGERPTAKHTLERKDNDGLYAPGNCIWATNAAQQFNRSNNHRITFQGRTQTLTEWAREACITPASLSHRIRKQWPLEKALTTPLIPRALRKRSHDQT